MRSRPPFRARPNSAERLRAPWCRCKEIPSSSSGPRRAAIVRGAEAAKALVCLAPTARSESNRFTNGVLYLEKPVAPAWQGPTGHLHWHGSGSAAGDALKIEPLTMRDAG